MAYFPPGMSLITVGVQLVDPTGDPEAGSLRVEYERVFGYAGTSWIAQRYSKWYSTKNGVVSVQVPHSNQAGLLGDNGGAVTDLAVKFEFRPVRESVIRTLGYVQLPTSLGASVNLSALSDLGGWPHQTIVYVTAPGGGSGTYVPVTVLGSSGYWSPA